MVKSLKEFLANPAVRRFLLDVVKHHYPSKYTPKWVNYTLFEEDMCNLLGGDLYDAVKNGDDDVLWRVDDLMGAFVSQDLNVRYCYDNSGFFEKKIPKELHNVYESPRKSSPRRRSSPHRKSSRSRPRHRRRSMARR